jgi:hypothetical protein
VEPSRLRSEGVDSTLLGIEEVEGQPRRSRSSNARLEPDDLGAQVEERLRYEGPFGGEDADEPDLVDDEEAVGVVVYRDHRQRRGQASATCARPTSIGSRARTGPPARGGGQCRHEDESEEQLAEPMCHDRGPPTKSLIAFSAPSDGLTSPAIGSSPPRAASLPGRGLR